MNVRCLVAEELGVPGKKMLQQLGFGNEKFARRSARTRKDAGLRDEKVDNNLSNHFVGSKFARSIIFLLDLQHSCRLGFQFRPLFGVRNCQSYIRGTKAQGFGQLSRCQLIRSMRHDCGYERHFGSIVLFSGSGNVARDWRRRAELVKA